MIRLSLDAFEAAAIFAAVISFVFVLAIVVGTL